MELIYSKFEHALTGKYINTNDYLNLLADSIATSDYLANAEIYIDGFHSFTPQEYMVIDQLMKKCKRLSIALVLDRPYKGEMPDDLDLFRMTGETYSTLYEIARQGGITVEDDVILKETPRFQAESLNHLESAFDKRPVQAFNSKSAIELESCG